MNPSSIFRLVSSTSATFKARGARKTVAATWYHLLGAASRAAGKRYLEKRIYDYRMLLDLNDRGISRTLLLFGERELEHKAMLEQVLRPGMTVLDIGANIGYYALMEKRLIGPGGVLIAVEPSPSNVGLLRRNLALNGYGDTEVHQGAVSDQSGTKRFFLSEMSNLNTFHDTGSGAHFLSGKTVDVVTFTVPEIMAGRKPDLIRMDVEGHEVEVFAGLLPAIERGEMAPMVIFETHLSRYGREHDMELPLRRFFALGYRVLLAGSSWEQGTKLIEAKGYRGTATIASDGVVRTIFEDIGQEDAIDLICREGGIRTVLLGRGPLEGLDVVSSKA
ncbi:MAG: FkbM family methyltransferase [Thermodesulfobacteriota bacterium]